MTSITMDTPVCVTDNGVRDHPQQAKIKNEVITVSMKVGRRTAGSYTFPLSEWLAADRGPSANENWNRKKLIERHTARFQMHDQDGGPCQADRIIDSQISAIKKAVTKLKGGDQ